MVSSHQPDAIYLNAKFQTTQMTNNIEQQMLPTRLFIGSQAYPIQCRYLEAQPYIQAIATGKPKADIAYKASAYFYHYNSPQINTILTCQADITLSEQPRIQFSDTYPWYQPLVEGGPNKPAAGDALTYVYGNQLIVVLGHEPCACNDQTEEQCSKLKKVSREYHQRAWTMVTALQDEQTKHSPKAQQYMNDYFAYAKNELKKDYCYIDKDGMIERLNTMLEGIGKSEKGSIFND